MARDNMSGANIRLWKVSPADWTPKRLRVRVSAPILFDRNIAKLCLHRMGPALLPGPPRQLEAESYDDLSTWSHACYSTILNLLPVCFLFFTNQPCPFSHFLPKLAAKLSECRLERLPLPRGSVEIAGAYFFLADLRLYSESDRDL